MHVGGEYIEGERGVPAQHCVMIGRIKEFLFHDSQGLAPWRAHIVENVHPEIPNATLLAQGKWIIRGKVQHFRTYRDWHGRRVEEVSEDGKNWKRRT